MEYPAFQPVQVQKDYTFAGLQQSGFGLESVHKCNGTCAFCVFGHYEHQKVTNLFTGESWIKQKKLMKWSLLEAIVARHKPEIIILTGQTEPFLDPRIPNIIKLGCKHNKNFKLSIFSNASVMTKTMMDKIIPNEHFISINFSLNALTDGTRQDVMGLSNSPAVENINYFLEKRRECGREKQFEATSALSDGEQDLRVGISFLATHGTHKGKKISNLHEMEPFKAVYNDILRKYHCNYDVGIFPAGNWGGAIPREMMNQTMTDINPTGCGQWDCTGPTIDVDGQIMLCCYNSRWSFGSCLDDTAMGRWHHRREIFGVQGNTLHATPLCTNSSYRFVPTKWNEPT